MSDKVRLLHVEDSPIIAQLIQGMFASEKSISVDIEHFVTVKEAMERLAKGNIDIVLTDLQLPDSDGLNTFNRIYAEAPDIPIIIMTGTYEEEEIALTAIKNGAQDYLRKSEASPDTLVRAVRYAMERQYTKNELKRVSDELNVLYKELKGAYADLKTTQERLVQSEKLAGLVRFSEGIAHEVRNPLGIIIGGSEILEKKLVKSDKETRESVEMIKRAAIRASEILKTFLVYSVSKNKAAEKVNFGAMMEEICASIKKTRIAPNIKLSTDIAKEDMCVKVVIDQVQEAVLALFNNSVEAMPSGGTITIKAYKGSDPKLLSGRTSCIIEVNDTGVGISKENMPKMFEPFFTTSQRKREGAGRGLFVTKNTVESLEGQITIDSEVGKGTSVKIGLPPCNK